jgi:hypothetical protein
MAGLVLVLTLAQFCVRRVDAALMLSIAQGVAASVALAAQQLWMPSGALLISTIWLSLTCRRLLDATAMERDAPSLCGIAPAIAIGALLVLLAMAADAAGLPFSLVLLGLLLSATRTHPMMRVLGLFTAQLGAALAAGVAEALPWPALVAAIVPVVPALALGAVWVGEHPGKAPLG